jgi:hypothetical protein
MYLFNKHINDINEDDIKRLQDNAIAETKLLDYKLELKIGSDEEKKEFLADITAMANTEGGLIIYGIEEGKDGTGKSTGIASKIVGISVPNKDKLLQQIEDTIRSNTDPKITTIGVSFIKVEGVDIFLLGVSKFISLPHMMTYKSSNKYYKRRNTGKYLVDSNELYELFMNNFLIKDRANNFVKERITEIRNGGLFPNLDLVGSFFLHIVPIGHIGNNLIDIVPLRNTEFLQLKMRPLMSGGGWDHNFNLDGFMAYSAYDKKVHSFTQLFRDGILEFYTSHFHSTDEPNKDIFKINGAYIEQLVVESITNSFEIYTEFKIEGPYAIFINLFDTEKGILIGDNRLMHYRASKIGRSNIFLPSIIIKSSRIDLWGELKPIFDILWQSGGYRKSPYYKDDGTRIK